MFQDSLFSDLLLHQNVQEGNSAGLEAMLPATSHSIAFYSAVDPADLVYGQILWGVAVHIDQDTDIMVISFKLDFKN